MPFQAPTLFTSNELPSADLRTRSQNIRLLFMLNSPNELLKRLEALKISTTTVEHPAVFTVKEAKSLRGELSGGHSKNLFLKDKKGQLWLLVALEDREINFKALRTSIGSAQLSFAKPELLMEVLGLRPGSVTPFGVINDTSGRVNVVLDKALMTHTVLNFHPMINTATTRITPDGLRSFLIYTGHYPLVADL